MKPLPGILFEPLGLPVSRICFGCGTLVGRGTLKQSAAMIETALDLGIRYFDTAPSYGFGTAEEVIGAVIGNMPDVIVASKVGYARPTYSGLKNAIRKSLKPILDRSRPIKTFARSLYAKPVSGKPAGSRQALALTDSAVRRSLAATLRLLKRDRLDVFLAHDADTRSLTDEAREVFDTLTKEGAIGCYGVAVSDSTDREVDFGNVWQSAWPRNPSHSYSSPCTYIHHGVIRSAPKTRWGNTLDNPADLLQAAVRSQPEALFIVATSTPRKLKDLVARLR